MEVPNLSDNLTIDLYHGFNIDNVSERIKTDVLSVLPNLNVCINEIAYDIYLPNRDPKEHSNKQGNVCICFFLFLIDDLQRLTNSISLPVDISIDMIYKLLDSSLTNLGKSYDFVCILNPFSSLKDISQNTDSHFDKIESALKLYINKICVNRKNMRFFSHSLSSSIYINPKLFYYAALPFGTETPCIISSHIIEILKKIFMPIPKALVIDLDNTVWGGVVGEDGIESLQIGQTPVGNIFIQIQASIKRISDYGLPIIVVSKNNLEDAIAAFSDTRMLLDLSDFVSFNASWNPKYQSLIKALNKINLSLTGIYFLDDSIVERNEMQNNCSSINIINKQSDCISILKDLLTFESNLTGAEIANSLRNNSYKAIHDAEINRSSYANKDDFLSSLNMSFDFSPCDKHTMNRCLDLINKTNQFNLTTERLSIRQFKHRLSKNNMRYFTLAVKDIYTDHGVVGVIGLQFKIDVCIIRHFLLSCRMLNRDIEIKMLSKAKDYASSNHAVKIIGWYKQVPKSRLVKTFYADNYFSLYRKKLDRIYYIKDLTTYNAL